MSTARQVLRFGIPGGIGLAWGILVFGVVRRCAGQDISSVFAPIENHLSAAVAIVGTVPLGWLAYQLYYFLYRPLILGGLLLRRDRGGEVLALLTRDQMDNVRRIFPDLAGPLTAAYKEVDVLGRKMLRLAAPNDRSWGLMPPATARRDYASQWRQHWEIVRALVSFSAANGNAELREEFTTLADVYHGTGCARYALYCSWAVGGGFAFLQLANRHEVLTKPAIGLAASFVATFLLGSFVLHHVRRQAWKRSVALLGRGLRLAFAHDPALLDGIAARVVSGGEQGAALLLPAGAAAAT